MANHSSICLCLTIAFMQGLRELVRTCDEDFVLVEAELLGLNSATCHLSCSVSSAKERICIPPNTKRGCKGPPYLTMFQARQSAFKSPSARRYTNQICSAGSRFRTTTYRSADRKALTSAFIHEAASKGQPLHVNAGRGQTAPVE